MCTHEILAKDGFHPDFFLPRHFERVKVGGSLVGARHISGDDVDVLLGVETEVNDSRQVQEMQLVNGLTNETSLKPNDGSNETRVLMEMADSPSDLEANMVPDVSPHVTPPGYLPNNDHGTTPFTTKQVENILQSVIATYKRYPADKKFRLSGIVAELQEAMLNDPSTQSKSENPSGIELAIPGANVMIKEPKHRLKSG